MGQAQCRLKKRSWRGWMSRKEKSKIRTPTFRELGERIVLQHELDAAMGAKKQT